MRYLLALLASCTLLLGQGFEGGAVIGPRFDWGWLIPDDIPMLEDTFTLDLAAGSVTGTPADGRTPTMTRTVVDTYAFGDEIGSNLGFENGGGGGSDVFANWTESWSDPNFVIDETSIVHSAGHALKLVRGNANCSVYQNFAVTAGQTYALRFWHRNDSGSVAARYYFRDATAGVDLTASTAVGLNTDQTWTLCGPFYINAPTGCSSMRVYLVDSATAGTVYIDDVSFVKTTELLANNGFEVAGSPLGSWSVGGGTGDSAVTQDATPKYGSFAAKIVRGSTVFTYVYQTATVVPLQYYTISFWYRNTVGSGNPRLHILNAVSPYQDIVPSGTQGMSATTTYQFITVGPFQVPAGVTSMNVRLADGGAGTYYFDDVSLVPTTGLLSVTGGQLAFAGGKASPEVGDPGIWYPAQVRVAGKALFSDLSATTSGPGPYVGWDIDTTKNILNDGMLLQSELIRQRFGGLGLTIGSCSYGTILNTAVILRSAGSFSFFKNGTWKLGYVLSDASLTATPVYISIQNHSAAATVDNIRIPKTLYIPAPIASDSFNRALLGSTDGAGHAEANGGSGLAWQTGANNTWSISGGKLVNTPTTGENLTANSSFTSAGSWVAGAGWSVSGDGKARATAANYTQLYQSVLNTDAWYAETWTLDSVSGGIRVYYSAQTNPLRTSPGTYNETFRAVNTSGGVRSGSASSSGVVDDVLIYPLTLSDLFATVNAGTPDVIVDVAVNGSNLANAGVQEGIVLNLDSPTTPTAFTIVYIDGAGTSGTAGNIRVEKYSGGSYASLLSATSITYSSGATLRVVRDTSGTGEYRVFYNNVAVGGALVDATLTGTYHGTFSTSSTATFGPVAIWARGNQGQYSQLDTLK